MLHVTHLLHILYWIIIWTPAYKKSSVESYDAMKPIIRVSVGHDGAHFAADWDLEKIEVQEILNDGEDIYGPTLQFKVRSFKYDSCHDS